MKHARCTQDTEGQWDKWLDQLSYPLPFPSAARALRTALGRTDTRDLATS